MAALRCSSVTAGCTCFTRHRGEAELAVQSPCETVKAPPAAPGQDPGLPLGLPLRACSIQEGLKQARKAGDDKKLGMVASRKCAPQYLPASA